MTDALDPAALEPCPFCGGPARLCANDRQNMAWVACLSCGLESPSETGWTADKAIAAWNRRAYKEAAAALSMPGWRTIDSAPKDGTRIFLLLEPLPHHAPFRSEIDWRDIGYWTEHNGGGWVHYLIGNPVKWCPLPAAPDITEVKP